MKKQSKGKKRIVLSGVAVLTTLALLRAALWHILRTQSASARTSKQVSWTSR
ncbi:MAG: hypothetical protein ACLVDB_00575 [Anaeromassilibacillus sp.]